MTSPGGRSVDKVTVRVVPDTSGFGEKVKAYLERLEKQLELKIPLKLDDRHLANQLEKLEAKMKAATADGIKVPIQFEGGQAHINRQFEQLTRRVRAANNEHRRLNSTVNIGTGIFRGMAQSIGNSLGIFGSLGRFAGGASGSMSALSEAGASGAGSMAKFGSAAGLAASSLIQLTTYGLLATGVVGALGIALAAIAPAVLGISGTIAGLGVVVGTVALGMDGIKKAAKAAKPAVDELKKALSDTFERLLTPVFQRLNDNVIPQLQAGFVRVAEAISRVFSDLVGVVESGRNMMRLNQVIRNTELAINNLSVPLRMATGAFLELAAVASLSFNNFVNGPLKRAVDDFGTMIVRLRENQTLLRAFDGLGAIVEGVLFLVTDLLEAGAELAAQWGPRIGESFKKFGDAIKDSEPSISRLVVHLLDLADWVSRNLPGMLDKLADFVDLLKKIGDGADKLDHALDGADSALNDFGKSLHENFIMKIVNDFRNLPYGEMWEGIKQGFTWLIDQLVNFLSGDPTGGRVRDAIQNKFANWTNIDWTGIAAKLGVGIQWLLQQISDFFSGELPGGQENPISAWFNRKLDEAGDFIFAKIQEWAPKVWQWIVDAFWGKGGGGGAGGGTAGTVGLGPGFQQKLLEMFAAGRAVLPQLPAMIGEFFSQAYNVSRAWLQLQVDNARTKWDEMRQSITQKAQQIRQSVTDRFNEIRESVRQKIDSIGQSIRDGFQRAVDWARDKLSRMRESVQQKLNEIEQFFRSLPGKIIGALESLPGALFSAGARMGQALVDGLVSKAQAVGRAAADLAKQAANALVGRSPTKVGPLSGRGWTLYGGIKIGEALAQGMLQTRAIVSRAALELAHAARPDLNTALGDMRARLSAGLDEFDPDAPAQSIYQAVYAALHNVRIRIDGNGVAKLVNEQVALAARR